VAYLLPADRLLLEPTWLRYLVGSVVAFAPIFFANLVFSHSFRDTWTADMAFAVNLLGAMLGGALEYIALVTGYQALLILIGALYLGAALAGSRFRFLADSELARDPEQSASTA
jgi:ABC-type multidrug transport system permease subunit